MNSLSYIHLKIKFVIPGLFWKLVCGVQAMFVHEDLYDDRLYAVEIKAWALHILGMILEIVSLVRPLPHHTAYLCTDHDL